MSIDHVSVPEESGEELYEHHSLRADKGQRLMRIDTWLTIMLPNVSRTRIKNASLADCIRVFGKPVKASYKLKPLDEVSLVLPYPPAPDAQAEQMDLDIRYEDDHLLLVSKPAGMVVHPALGHYSGTLVNGLMGYLGRQLPAHADPDAPIRPGLVHRIDKETSGLLVIAKTDTALTGLARQFFDHSCERTYYAVAWGDIKQNEGTIIGNVGRSQKDRKKFTVYPPDSEHGKHAVTHYKVLERFGCATLVQCNLETGRTHQIRVHMKHIGHTLMGDYEYGGDKVLYGQNHGRYADFISRCLSVMRRQALHAKTLGFVHPATGKWMQFDSDLPPDFQQLLQLLRNQP